ncbi:sensor histidine kinase [Deinococcus psychrotolerans]|uniref:Sensor histidine kinase n=1 Tax=Deinococcus psychrotolerans TaxID=2489213 RepID=A0A3G8YMT7_9DEIO|nr:sensor histidine kinase [Deinococcus psychrotolerans]AZI42891.1 sensor histidine kinase [Deinococcus psychrotolerans]
MPSERKQEKWGRFWRLFPLVWLVYLYFPISGVLGSSQPETVKLLTVLGVVVFVWLWTQLYNQREARVRHVRHTETHQFWVLAAYVWCLVMFAGLTLLPGLLSGNGFTFLVYGAAVAGFQRSFRVALWGLIGVVFAMFVPGWFGAAPLGLFDIVQVLLLSSFAMYGNHAGFRQGISQQRLEEVQLEKEKLAADAERERIARDLHDLLGHTLSVIVLKSELASKLAEKNPARAAQEIREVERISREALSEVRAAVQGYKGSGLSAELARSKVALDAAGVRLILERPPLELPPATEAGLSMVLREAVTNVVRHARAKTCTIRIEEQESAYWLEVTDDGVGGATPEGSGLTGMRERVRALGGELRREGESGTRLSAKFPIQIPSALPNLGKVRA